MRTESEYITFKYTEEVKGDTPENALDRITSSGTELRRLRLEKPNTGYWLYIDEKKLGDAITQLRIVPGLVHELTVYQVNETTTKVIGQSSRAGRFVPISQWDNIQHRYIIPIHDKNGVRNGHLLRVEMRNIISIFILGYTDEASNTQEEIDDLIFYLLLGMVSVLVVVVITIWGSTKDVRYAWLSLALIALTTIEVSAQGYGHVYLWGNFPDFSIRCISLASGIFMFAYINFAASSLPTRVASSKVVQIAGRVVKYTAVILFINVIYGDFDTAVALLSVASLCTTILIVGINLLFVRRASHFIRLMLAGQIVIAVVGVLRLLDLFGVKLIPDVYGPLLRESEYMLVWVLLLLLIFFFITAHLVAENIRMGFAQQSALDILESRVLERTKELEVSRSESLKIGALQRDFLATMSHELRTPLSSIIGLCRMMRKNKDIDLEIVKRDVGVMERMAFHILNMVEDGLDFIQNKKLTNLSKIKEVELRAMCRDIISIGEWLSQNQKNTFKFTTSRDVPTTLLFDEQKVRQVLINFLSNAGRYCEGGEIHCNISFYDGNSPILKFDIRDTGRGMSKEDLDKYLHPFVKSRDSVGLGLGLAITKDLINQMGGDFSIQSSPGVGTHVSFEIKVEQSLTESDTSLDELDKSERNSYADTVPMGIDEMSAANLSRFDGLRELLVQGRITEAEEFMANLSQTIFDDLDSERFFSNAKRFLSNLELDLLIEYIDKASKSSAGLNS